MTGTDLIQKIDYGFLTEFDPARFKQEMAKVDAIKDLAVKLKDQELLSRAAFYRATRVDQAVAYYNGEVDPMGGHGNLIPGGPRAKEAGNDTRVAPREAAEIAAELGFSERTIQRWRETIWPDWPEGKPDAEAYEKELLTAWLIAADIIEKVVTGGGGGGGGGDPLSTIKKAIEKLPEPSEIELRDWLNSRHPPVQVEYEEVEARLKKRSKTKTLPKPDYNEDDFTGIVEKPADYRVTKAVHAFFNDVPGNKRVWVQQRMEEQPSTMKGSGVHVEWIEAFWDSDPEVQSAIREEIKIENMRRMEG